MLIFQGVVKEPHIFMGAMQLVHPPTVKDLFPLSASKWIFSGWLK